MRNTFPFVRMVMLQSSSIRCCCCWFILSFRFAMLCLSVDSHSCCTLETPYDMAAEWSINVYNKITAWTIWFDRSRIIIFRRG